MLILSDNISLKPGPKGAPALSSKCQWPPAENW